MAGTGCDRPSEERADRPPHYVSFVLRCWTASGGHLRARLLDVRSGIQYPVADLSEVPSLVRRLMAEAAADRDL